MEANPRPAIDRSRIAAALAQSSGNDPTALVRAASLAMNANCEEEGLPALRRGVERHPSHAQLWQMLGLTARNLGDLTIAVEALATARKLSPRDALIAHGAARARLEAGLSAVDDFRRCRQLAPNDGGIILGLAAARFAEREVAGAIDEIARVVNAEPLWLDGHATLARLRRMAGDADDLASYREALARNAGIPQLWHGLLSTLIAAERFDEVLPLMDSTRRAIGNQPWLDLFEAIASDETGEVERAGRFFDQLEECDPQTAIARTRSLIRRERYREASDFAVRRADLDQYIGLWPYLALVWRLLGDPRWQWLEGDASFVQVYDLGDALADPAALAERLRGLHIASEQPLDQSVRNGTQTDGPLLSRIEPEITQLRATISAAVGRYVAALPPKDPAHPLLSPRRTPLRFAGSWSVRLTDGGFHSDHFHGQGWISSALYVSLPETMSSTSNAGWLSLGESRALIPTLAAVREIEPKVGRLVLFPSTMWHGTRPFPAGERITVAFDVARLG